jgi:hypothetical protein
MNKVINNNKNKKQIQTISKKNQKKSIIETRILEYFIYNEFVLDS